MQPKKKHIDDVQAPTADEHLRLLMNDKDIIESEIFTEVTPTDLPDWYDEELYKEGQRYFESNVFGISVAGLAGLIAVLAIPSILEVLIFTKGSGTPCTAFRRYLETILHVRAWNLMDSKEKDSNWYKSMNTVRFKHCNASRQALRKGLGGITQRDMALTQFGFIGYVLLRPEYLGLTNTKKQREGINHLWRVNGHMLGISDSLNICRKSEAETTELCVKLQDQVFGKYFKEVPQNFIEMSEIMLDGMWAVDMAMDKDATMAFTYQMTGLPYHKKLGLYSWLNLKYREAVHTLCGLPYVGRLVRGYYYYLLEFNYMMITRWPVVAWLTFGVKESEIHLYPPIK